MFCVEKIPEKDQVQRQDSRSNPVVAPIAMWTEKTFYRQTRPALSVHVHMKKKSIPLISCAIRQCICNTPS